VVRALRAACRARGVTEVREPAARVDGGATVTLASGRALQADVAVVAAGCRSGELVDLPVRPVKGQILRLRGDVAGLLTRTIRGGPRGVAVYLVPRATGELVVGATVEERGFDTSVTAGAVHELLEAARHVVPGVDELELAEARAGLRPGTPDNAPIIGAAPGRPGVLVATGHFRNGILLAPVTADAIADLVVGRSNPATAPFHPGRFA
jgi:glycine oxidase